MTNTIDSSMTIVKAMDMIKLPEFHRFWRDHWADYVVVVMQYNYRLKEAHDKEYAALPSIPCPVDLTNGLIPGSDDEWEYQQWLEASKAPEFVKWSTDSASTCPDWVEAHKDDVGYVRNIANTFNGADGWVGIMTNPKAIVEAEWELIKAEEYIEDCLTAFMRIAPTAFPDQWTAYCADLDRAKVEEADKAAQERIAISNAEAMRALAPALDSGRCVSIADASRMIVNIGSQLEVLAEALPALAANSQQQELVSAQDTIAMQECVFKLYSCNCSQLKGIQELCRWLAAGRTGKNKPISRNVTRTVYGWLLESITDDSVKNAVFEPWFMEHVEGTRLHNAICQRIGAIPPKSVVIALTRSQTLMNSL